MNTYSFLPWHFLTLLLYHIYHTCIYIYIYVFVFCFYKMVAPGRSIWKQTVSARCMANHFIACIAGTGQIIMLLLRWFVLCFYKMVAPGRSIWKQTVSARCMANHFIACIAGTGQIIMLLLRWFKPEHRRGELLEWMRSVSCSVQKQYHVLDLFGASQRVSQCWQKAGWKATSYDIKLGGPFHDITSEDGWKTLANKGLRLLACMCESKTKILYSIVSRCTVFRCLGCNGWPVHAIVKV